MDKRLQEVAAFWNERPCNSRHATITIDMAPGLWSGLVTERKRFVEPHLWRFAQFPAWRGKRVLDAGCGIGTEVLEFARHGADVAGLDLSGKSLEIAIRRVMAVGLSYQIGFKWRNIEGPPMDEDREAYDLVWAWGSVHHTPNPEAAMQQLARYLKPGGQLRMMVYHRVSTKALRLWAKAGFPRDFDAAVALGSEAQPGCPITYTYTRRMARKLVEGAGLVVESIHVDHIFPYDGELYGKQHLYVRARPWRWIPKRIFRLLERVLGWHLMIVARRPIT